MHIEDMGGVRVHVMDLAERCNFGPNYICLKKFIKYE